MTETGKELFARLSREADAADAVPAPTSDEQVEAVAQAICDASRADHGLRPLRVESFGPQKIVFEALARAAIAALASTSREEVELLRDVVATLRDYVADAAAGTLTYEDSGDGFIAMAKEDLARLDAALTQSEAPTPARCEDCKGTGWSGGSQPRDKETGEPIGDLCDACEVCAGRGTTAPASSDVGEDDALFVRVLTDLLAYAEQDECQHNNRHRGGAIWTICDDCDRKWADDEGGFRPYEEPAPIASARAFLSNKGEG